MNILSLSRRMKVSRDLTISSSESGMITTSPTTAGSISNFLRIYQLAEVKRIFMFVFIAHKNAEKLSLLPTYSSVATLVSETAAWCSLNIP